MRKIIKIKTESKTPWYYLCEVAGELQVTNDKYRARKLKYEQLEEVKNWLDNKDIKYKVKKVHNREHHHIRFFSKGHALLGANLYVLNPITK